MKFGLNKRNIISGLINRYDTAFECVKIIWKFLFANATSEELNFLNTYKNKVKLWNSNGALDTIWIDYIIDIIEKFSTIDTFIADIIGIYYETLDRTLGHESEIDVDVLFIMTYIYLAFHIDHIQFSNLSASVVSSSSGDDHDIYLEDMPIIKVYIKKLNTTKQCFAIPLNSALLVPTQRTGNTIYFNAVTQNVGTRLYRKTGFDFSLEKFKLRMEKHQSTADLIWRNEHWSEYKDIIKSGSSYPTRLDFNYNAINASIKLDLYSLSMWVPPITPLMYKYAMSIFSPEAVVTADTVFEEI